ncbi:ATPase [Taibaiella lutea]|uniref:ATPase n=1 Tax=Taibaiella lutea TaxID=2608001 RepID=A0A5M6CMI5_9BACT|nr:SRPBCC domain-containing protein [Taibaiella lutea]KAA5536421.1 ATPase [Taibaiella lutea]
MARNISSIIINTTQENVWNALTQPELVKLWQFGSELITNWEAGSPIKFRTAWEDKVFEQWGKVIEVHPYESIRYSLFAPRPDLEDKPENYFEMSYLLEPKDNGTMLTIVQHDNRPGAVQEDPQGAENAILQSLKQVAESQE